VQIVDVREPAGLADALGHTPGALGVPLSQLAARAGELRRDPPIVTVCRSGARSAQATALLAKAGFKDVADLAGGMLRWRHEGHRVEGPAA
jgi:rhodanese-related sulfurtransferase